MLPIELFKPIFADIRDKSTLVALSTLCKSLQPTIESILWTRLSLLRTYANNNPVRCTEILRLIAKRTGKYVKRVEINLGFLVQWVHWERTETGENMERICGRLAESLNTTIMTNRLRLVEMDDRSAPPEISVLLTRLHFPRLRQLYYTGTFKPEFQGFLDRHPTIKTLFVGTDGSCGAHGLFFCHRFERPKRLLLPNLSALETTVPILHALMPLLDSSTPLTHITISFGFHGSLSYLDEQINHLSSQNVAYTNIETGLLEGLVLPSVRILRLEKLVDECYADALECLLPRFPNLTDIGNVILSKGSECRLIPILPVRLKQIHFIYEGIMWEAEFTGVTEKLRRQCKILSRLELWAWSEAYYDLWICRWGHNDSLEGEIWNLKTYGRSVSGNPAILWISENCDHISNVGF